MYCSARPPSKRPILQINPENKKPSVDFNVISPDWWYLNLTCCQSSDMITSFVVLFGFCCGLLKVESYCCFTKFSGNWMYTQTYRWYPVHSIWFGTGPLANSLGYESELFLVAGAWMRIMGIFKTKILLNRTCIRFDQKIQEQKQRVVWFFFWKWLNGCWRQCRGLCTGHITFLHHIGVYHLIKLNLQLIGPYQFADGLAHLILPCYHVPCYCTD